MAHTMHCQGEENPQNCPFPLRLRHPAGGPSHCNMQNAQQFGKDHACGSEDILANRQTDTQTDVLITILRHRYCGRSNLYIIIRR